MTTPFLSLSVNSDGERGLLGIAFDPGFANNHFVYVYYTTAAAPVHNRISRFTANGDVAMPGSEVVLLDLDNLSGATNHNGGAIHFGPDGKLYAGVGENANSANAQTLGNLLGKILRINADGTIPPDNPFFATASGKNRAIWALGLRNPFTFAFNRASGRMFIDDVGASTWEEIDDGITGSNYGWPQVEGPQPPGVAGVRYPIHSYAHTAGACAISGGTFYAPPVPQFPADYSGDYFFADLCAGFIRRLHLANGSVSDFATGISNPVDLQVGPEGALYYLARGSGSVVRITSDTGPPVRALPVWHDFFAVNPFETPYVGDFNGDHLTDIVTFTRQNPSAVGDVYVALSDGTRFSPSAKWHDWFAVSPGEQVVIGDYDGDGKDDIATWLATTTRQVYVALSTGSGMAHEAVWMDGIGFDPTDVLASGDVNGDGRQRPGALRAHAGQGVRGALGRNAVLALDAVAPLLRGVDARAAASRGRERRRPGRHRDLRERQPDAPSGTSTWPSPTARGSWTRTGCPTARRSGTTGSPSGSPSRYGSATSTGTARTTSSPSCRCLSASATPSPRRGTRWGRTCCGPWTFSPTPSDGPFVGDVDGDGRADVIVFAKGEGKVYVSLGR